MKVLRKQVKKIVKRLFPLVYGQEKYRYSVRNVAMVLVAAIALGSSTYAWFAANDRVTATGLKATAQTGSSAFLIAENGDNITDNDFKTTVELNAAATKLAPVSTIDGTNFFWTPGTNVKGNGDAINDVYTAYDETNFKSNFSNAVGYIEYDVSVKPPRGLRSGAAA